MRIPAQFLLQSEKEKSIIGLMFIMGGNCDDIWKAH